jgi:ADP-sugar diphosphatase
MRAVTMKEGFKLPSYIFLRGHAVGILMFVNDKLLLTEQYRVPVQETLLEVPAGMIDESGDFIGVAAKEIEEETGIKIKNEDLKLLGSFYPSPGGCDEQLFMYLCRIKRSEEELKAIMDKIHGDSEHERIRLRLVDYSPDIILKTKDSKLIYGAYAYDNLVKGKANL